MLQLNFEAIVKQILPCKYLTIVTVEIFTVHTLNIERQCVLTSHS